MIAPAELVEGDYLERVEDDVFFVDYATQILIVWWNAVEYVFSLKDGDVGDFWCGFETPDGLEYDLNFFKEDEKTPPGINIYNLKIDPVWSTYSTSEQVGEIVKYWERGNPEEYFNRVNDEDWEIQRINRHDELKIKLWGRDYRLNCQVSEDGKVSITSLYPPQGGDIAEFQRDAIRRLLKRFYEKEKL
jgi:hypothetical protein